MRLDLSDGIIAAGALLVSAGLWWVYPPAALILGGAGLIAFGRLLPPTKG